MNVKLFNTLFDEVLIDVPGVTQDVALNAIRKAAIEFCDKSKVWQVDADPIDSIAGQANYQFEPDAGSEVCGIVQASYNGLPIGFATEAQLDKKLSVAMSVYSGLQYGDVIPATDGLPNGIPWQKKTGTPLFYTQERPDEFILAPFPDQGIAGAIVLKVAVKPTRTATGMEQWILDKYFEELASGAKAKLYAMAKKPWTDANLSVFHRNLFEAGIRAASAISAFKLPNMASAPSPI